MEPTERTEHTYIDLDVAIERLMNAPRKFDSDGYGWLTLYTAVDVLDNTPPADVRPVARGEWIETGYFDQDYQPIYECSQCHREVADNFMAKHLFCLHCGADMRPEPQKEVNDGV